MDEWMDKQPDEQAKIHRLEQLCFAYPPDLAEIEVILKKIPDISIFKEIYAKDIIQLFLRYGYDLTAVDGKVGAACLHALVWSNFNQDMAEVAKLFLDAGADPLISYYGEEDSSTLDCIEFHRYGTDWYFGEGEDCDYFDNRSALDAYYELCEKAIQRRQEQ